MYLAINGTNNSGWSLAGLICELATNPRYRNTLGLAKLKLRESYVTNKERLPLHSSQVSQVTSNTEDEMNRMIFTQIHADFIVSSLQQSSCFLFETDACFVMQEHR